LARRFFHLAFEKRHEVIAVEMHFERLAPRCVPFRTFGYNIRVTGRRAESWQEVLMSKEIAINSARLDHARPANQARGSIASPPIGALLATIRGGATIPPRHPLGPVVRAVDHDRVVGDPKVIEFLK